MIQNTGFETADPSTLETGVAQYWVSATHGTGEETATFAGDTGRAPLGYETFGFGWGWLDPQHLRVTLADSEVESRPGEDFSGWVLNQEFIGLGALEAATFNTHSTTTETFEAWVPMVDTDFVFSTAELQRAQFNGNGEENFVWGSFDTSFGSLQAASFDSGVSNAEQFAHRGYQRMFANLAAHLLMRYDGFDYEGDLGDQVTLTPEGEGGSIPSDFAEGVTYYVRSISGSAVALGFYPIGAGDAGDIVVTDRGSGVFRINQDPARFWLVSLD